MSLELLWAEIQASPACAPHVYTNDQPKLSGAEVAVKDQAIADILSVGRMQVVSHVVTERGVLEALGPADGDAFLTALESIQVPENLPGALRPHIGAIRRGVAWLKSDGLDVGSGTARSLLDGLAAFTVVSAIAVSRLKALAERPAVVTAADVSRAVRGPRS